MLEEDKEVVYEHEYTWQGKKFRVVRAEDIHGIYYFPEIYRPDSFGALQWEATSKRDNLQDAVFDLGYAVGITVMSMKPEAR